MSLTLGSGPFSPDTTGRFDAGTRTGEHTVFVQPVDRRVRGWLGDRLVVDTTGAQLVHESGRLPAWWLPVADVADGVLSPAGTEDDPKGTLRRHAVGDRTDAAATLEEPADGVPDLAGLVRIDVGALDRWAEEDEDVVGHPRDPYHRVDTRRTSRHVVVTVDGEQVADTRRAVMVFETGLPVRYYLPREDVDAAVLEPSATTSVCPYKGVASYACVRGAEDAAWYYPEPFGEVLEARDHLSFWGDRVAVTVDGERVV